MAPSKQFLVGYQGGDRNRRALIVRSAHFRGELHSDLRNSQPLVQSIAHLLHIAQEQCMPRDTSVAGTVCLYMHGVAAGFIELTLRTSALCNAWRRAARDDPPTWGACGAATLIRAHQDLEQPEGQEQRPHDAARLFQEAAWGQPLLSMVLSESVFSLDSRNRPAGDQAEMRVTNTSSENRDRSSFPGNRCK